VVTKDLAGGTIGYIDLTGFSDNSAASLHQAVVADIAKGEKKLILDLRGNPGGFVTAARSVASEFIGKGTIFWQEDAQGNKTATEATPGGAATDPSIKVVVLIDKGSASASEIVAGAMRDTKRATLIGETTFGKGTVQEWTPLEGAGGFKLTVAKWLTPDQEWIHHKGIDPDVKVTVPANLPAGQDPVLDKAVQVLGQAATAGVRRAA
jgi:carboxyl-terminal processing protease